MKKLITLNLLAVALLPGCGGTPVVTLSEFQQIQPGMTYDQVAQIVGDPGSQFQSQEMMGIKSDTYMWENGGGPNMVCMFQNGKLINKTQVGLR